MGADTASHRSPLLVVEMRIPPHKPVTARSTAAALERFRQLVLRRAVVDGDLGIGEDGGQGREEFGGKDVNDVLNLIKLAQSLPFVEPTKIVMLGFSRGGMMTYLAIKHGA